jgi:hypothetical protein
VALLKLLGVNGTQAEFETLVEEVKGHALTLNLYLRDAYAGDIHQRDQVRLKETWQRFPRHGKSRLFVPYWRRS